MPAAIAGDLASVSEGGQVSRHLTEEPEDH
jgi:hypothetical protein